MSSAIIRFEGQPDKLVYWKNHAYPAGLGFKLLDFCEMKPTDIFDDKTQWEYVTEVPKDIQYEYVITKHDTVECKECWFTADKNYHGGGFRYGGSYDLKEWRKKIELQEKYAYRLPQYWS